jgi:hypothetical protein
VEMTPKETGSERSELLCSDRDESSNNEYRMLKQDL